MRKTKRRNGLRKESKFYIDLSSLSLREGLGKVVSCPGVSGSRDERDKNGDGEDVSEISGGGEIVKITLPFVCR